MTTVRLVIIFFFIVPLSKEYVGKNFRLQSRLQNAGLDCILGKNTCLKFALSEFGRSPLPSLFVLPISMPDVIVTCWISLVISKTNCYCYVAISVVFHVN